MNKQEERIKNIEKIKDRIEAAWAYDKAIANLPRFCVCYSGGFETHKSFRDVCDDMLYLYRCIDSVEVQISIGKDKVELPSRDFGWTSGVGDLFHLHTELKKLLEKNEQPPTPEQEENDAER